MDFKKILPENFFQLFNSKHRDLYIEALIKVYEVYEQGSILGMNKDDARDLIVELLDEKHENIADYEEDEITNYNQLANHFLRRFEVCGWIDIDVTNDYLELLNFRDYAITFVLSFIEIKKESTYSLFADNEDFMPANDNDNAFRGYIYTIYSLLTTDSSGEYGLILNQVYRNTISFVREIRKVDGRLKEYISDIVSKTEIKELVELLMVHKDELIDRAYYKLKTFDNVNKYKLTIVKKLEEIQENALIMNHIANEYLPLCNYDQSLSIIRVNKQINDCIDIFNSLDQMILEIDRKNRQYISQTIAKIKYLLNEDMDISGQLNFILRHYAGKVKSGKIETAYEDIKKIFNITTIRALNQKSITSIRGTYERNENNRLVDASIDITKLSQEFFDSFATEFTELEINQFIDEKIKAENEVLASRFIRKNASFKEILRLLYIIVYASGTNEYEIIPLNELIDHNNYEIRNFMVRRKQG